MTTVYWNVERSTIVEGVFSLLEKHPLTWDQKIELEWYLDKCRAKGFANTRDEIRLCAERFFAGKRKVTAPGYSRRKRSDKERKKIMANVPAELTAAITQVIQEQHKAVAQYKSGVDKALNALVGNVMKKYKGDPAVIRELLIQHLTHVD